jgi:hypothetical protein
MRARRFWVAGLAMAGLAAGGFGYWRATRHPAVPARTLRIGYQHNPPYQVHHAGGPPTGLAVETVAEAAHRAGLTLEWTEVPAGPDEALRTAAVDLWPLITIRPERRAKLYISAPWLQADHVLVLRDRRPPPGPGFAERVSITAVAIHVRLVHERFPGAQTVEYADAHEALAHLCTGDVSSSCRPTSSRAAIGSEWERASPRRPQRTGSATRYRAWPTTARWR